jgi:hypothetical protein
MLEKYSSKTLKRIGLIGEGSRPRVGVGKAIAFLASLILACGAVLPASAQQPALANSEPGVSAGGKWIEYAIVDKMTEAKKTRFVLSADNGSGDDNAQVTLFCNDGKMSLADFRPNTRMAPPNRPGFWGQPQMEVTVRVDHSHSHHGWNWVNGHFLSMDKGTARELIGAQIFKVEFATPRGPQIAEFSPAGLDLARVDKACGLTPKKP